MSRVCLAINGAGGRVGQRLVALASADENLQLVAALEHAGYKQLGEDSGVIAGVAKTGVPITQDLPAGVDAVIDFSTPAGADAILAACVAKRVALVMATTGLEGEHMARVREAAKQIPLLWAPNMSLAVNLTMKLAEITAKALANHASGVDVEIIERHHRYKEDAPSGTALKFGEIIAGAMGQTEHVHGRHGRPGKRPQSEIGYHALRTGDNPGEHTIVYGLLGETIELTVRASNRDAYAHGALAAARFLVGKPAGFYGMNDVLGL